MMNQADIFKKIGIILNELQEQYEFLAQNPGQLNELELELFLANANFLSDHVEIVCKLNTANVPKELPQHTPVSISQAKQIPAKSPVQEQAPVVDELPEPKDYTFFEKPADLVAYVKDEQEESTPAFEFIINDQPEADKFDFEEQAVNAVIEQPLDAEEQQTTAGQQQFEEQPVQEPLSAGLKPDPVEAHVPPLPSVSLKEDKPAEKTVEKETAAPVRQTLNDLLANKNNAAPAAKEEDIKPVTNLKAAITLNEKLLYIKDLFNGYNLAYSEAIDLINKMPDLKSADQFLKNNYAEKNNWQAKQSTVDQFYKLLGQRFPNG